MQRRQFMTASLAASALALTRVGSSSSETRAEAQAGQAHDSSREFYQLRKYTLQGAQPKVTERYFAEALVPALGRLGMGPVGAFKLDFGPETPTFYLLIPSTALETLVTLDLHLGKDAEFLKAAQPFWEAPASSPAFGRVESSLLAAFEGWPRVKLTSASASKGKRIFQLRSYESPSERDHVRKVEMFHKGEFDFFKKAGFESVFFGDTMVGPRMPNLTYMLSAPDVTQLNEHWTAFGADPDWKKLSAAPEYSFEGIVNNITNLLLSPLECSRI